MNPVDNGLMQVKVVGVKLFCEDCTERLTEKEKEKCDLKYKGRHYYCSICRKID